MLSVPKIAAVLRKSGLQAAGFRPRSSVAMGHGGNCPERDGYKLWKREGFGPVGEPTVVRVDVSFYGGTRDSIKEQCRSVLKNAGYRVSDDLHGAMLRISKHDA